MIENYLIFAIATVLIFIWIDTDAAPEYASKLRIPLPRLKDFWEYKKSQAIFYPDYLAFYSNSFITRLLSCPYCLNVIFNIIFCLAFLGKFSLLITCVNILDGWLVYSYLSKTAKAT